MSVKKSVNATRNFKTGNKSLRMNDHTYVVHMQRRPDADLLATIGDEEIEVLDQRIAGGFCDALRYPGHIE